MNNTHLGAECLWARAAGPSPVTCDDVLAAFPQVEEDLEKLENVLVEVGIETGAPEGASHGDLRRPFDTIAVDNPVGLYFSEIGWIPLLTTEEEITLAKRMEAGQVAQEALDRDGHASEKQVELRKATQDGQVARDHLIRANSRLVISVAKKYANRGVPFLDLIQEGNVGLVRTAARFDYRLGNKFSTFATWWIRQAISRAVANQGRTIRLPVHVGDQINRLSRTARRLTQGLGREPTSEELAGAMGIPTRRVERLLGVARHPLSLELPTGDEGESQLSDFVVDEGRPDLDEAVAFSTLRKLIQEMLQDFPPRTVRILQMRYGLVDGETYTLEEVGKKLGLTRERVRQIEARALRRLRHPAYSRRLRDFLER